MRFAKYHGLGNDFVVVDMRHGEDAAVETPEAARALCDRHFGVGADGVLPILPPRTPDAEARMRVLNADGSEAEMCGNGIRCVAKHLYEHDSALRGRRVIRIETLAGVLPCEISADDRGRARAVSVGMGRPRLARGEIPMTGPREESFIDAPITAAGELRRATAVSMGNPHLVLFVPEEGAALRALAERIGPELEHHADFPNRTNVELVRQHGDLLEVVVWERGCGITLACGTGACATAAAACVTGRAPRGRDVRVRLLGGELAIQVAPDDRAVTMRGPATFVYEATIDLPALLATRAG